jgi:hypothetical protein
MKIGVYRYREVAQLQEPAVVFLHYTLEELLRILTFPYGKAREPVDRGGVQKR